MTKLDWDKAKKVAPEPKTQPIGPSWWWTIAKFDRRCTECGELVPQDSPYAWNQSLHRGLCQVCVDREGLAPAKSKRYMRWEKRG